MADWKLPPPEEPAQPATKWALPPPEEAVAPAQPENQKGWTLPPPSEGAEAEAPAAAQEERQNPRSPARCPSFRS